MSLSEILIDFKELIKSILYSKEESKDLFDTYYDDNIVYSNGKFINSKSISTYKNKIPLKYLIEYSTLKNLQSSYNKNNDTLTITGNGYNMEYTLPYNVSSLNGLEFKTKLTFETYYGNEYYIGLKKNQDNGMFIGYKLTENNIQFIINGEVVDTVSNTFNLEDYDLYFKIIEDTDNNQLRVAYYVRKYAPNNSKVLFDNGFNNTKTVTINNLEKSSYSFITSNLMDNGYITLKNLEIYNINTINEGLRFIDEVSLTNVPTIISVGEETIITSTVTDQYNTPLNNYNVSFYLNEITEEQLLYEGVTDTNGEVSFPFSSDEESSYNIICLVNKIPMNNIVITVGIDIDMTNYIDLTIVGNHLNLTYTNSLFEYDGDGVLVDWSDGTTEVYANGNLTHYYNDTDEDAEHNILIYGEITELNSGAFAKCTVLSEITLPDTITSLDINCFRECTNLTSITLSENLTELPNYCFYNCTKLEYFEMDDNITSLGEGCFQNCTNLRSITLSQNLETIVAMCFEGCTNLTSISIPDTVTSLGRNCFQNCTNLKNISLSEELTELPIHCFKNCSNLEYITLPDTIMLIDNSCFQNCSKLDHIIIPSNVVSLGDLCFADCTNLRNVNMVNQDSLETIGTYCFANTKIRVVYMPQSVRELGDYCFDGCSKLEIIYFRWTIGNQIIDYDNLTLGNFNTDCMFLIPNPNPQQPLLPVYVNKHYPFEKLAYLKGFYHPLFDGTTPVIKQTVNANANTQSNGISTFKGCVMTGWSNVNSWILSVDIRYQDSTTPLRYTGLILLTNTTTPFVGWGIRNWEGGVTRNPTISDGQGGTKNSTNFTKTPNTTLSDGAYGDYYSSGYSNWYTLHMKKDGTILKVYKEFSDGTVSETVTYDWSELDDPSNVTIGGATNTYSTTTASQYGSVAMKNLIVVNYTTM